MFDGGVFSRKAKRVPAHGVKDIIALHGLKPGYHIPDGVVPHMAHMQVARRVGEHFQAVVLGLFYIVIHLVEILPGPGLLPFGFNFAEYVFLLHPFASC